MKSLKRTGQAFAKARTYPWIGETLTGLVAIFTNEREAVVIFDPDGPGAGITGQPFATFSLEQYHEFKGEIVLSND
jgi:hypothetical protein